jgi:CheY-like chemotaxis protein
MPFDLPALLSEYLLPLLVLVPLAIVVVLIAARSHKDDHWSHSRNDLLGHGRNTHLGTESPKRVPLPTVRPDLPLTPLPSPQGAAPAAPTPSPTRPAPPEAATDAPAATPGVDAAPQATDASPAPDTPPAADDTPEPDFGHAPTLPMGLDEPIAPSTPFLSPSPGAPAPATDALLSPRRRASDAPAEAAAPTLPRRRATDRLGGPSAPAEGPTPVLIVDDSAVVRAKLGKLLSSNGFAVTTARHGQEALEAIGQQWFAVMVTDLEMPEMDGFELIAHVSGDLLTENLPIIAITGHEALHAQVHDAKGLYGIFKKPWNDRELLQRVTALSVLRPRA